MEASCSICSDIYNLETDEISAAPCGHVFHMNCLESWLLRSKTCPVCRTDVLHFQKLYFNFLPKENLNSSENEIILNLITQLSVKDEEIEEISAKKRKTEERVCHIQEELKFVVCAKDVLKAKVLKLEKSLYDDNFYFTNRSADLYNQLDANDIEIAHLRQDTFDAEKRASDLQQALQSEVSASLVLKAKVVKLEKKLNEDDSSFNNALADLADQLSAKDIEIAHLRQDTSDAEKRASDLQRAVYINKCKIANLRMKVTSKRKRNLKT